MELRPLAKRDEVPGGRPEPRATGYPVWLSLVAAAVLIASSSSAQFSEPVKDRLGRTIGYLQPSGDRTYVQDRCFARLGWVIHEGMNKGTYSVAGQKLADSPLPFMLLGKPSRSCPTPDPQ